VDPIIRHTEPEDERTTNTRGKRIKQKSIAKNLFPSFPLSELLTFLTIFKKQ
jgi:hypothetical protein